MSIAAIAIGAWFGAVSEGGAGQPIVFPKSTTLPSPTGPAFQKGERIQFPTTPVTVTPVAGNRLEDKRLSTAENAPSARSLRADAEESATPMDNRTPRRATSRTSDQRNWLTGDNDDRRVSDADFNIRDTSPESLEKPGFNQSEILGDLSRTRPGPKTQGQKQGPVSEEDDLGAKSAATTGISSHQDAALDLRQMFNAGGTPTTAAGDKAEFGLREFFQGADGNPGRPAPVPRGEGSRFLDAEGAIGAAPSPGGTLGIPGSIGQSAASLPPAILPDPTAKPTGGDPFAPRPDGNRSANSFFGQPTPSGGYAPGIGGYSSLPSPSLRPTQPSRDLLGPTRNEVPRRKF